MCQNRKEGGKNTVFISYGLPYGFASPLDSQYHWCIMDAASLLCNICPKRPTFSDVSHLLTHVSSKAHLSNYFKLQIRSHQEPEAGKLLDEYDLWYKANDIPKLLSGRMAAKETRKKSQGESGGGAGDAKLRVTNTTRDLVILKQEAGLFPGEDSSMSSASSSGCLDPRLSDPFLSVDESVVYGRNGPMVNCSTPITPSKHASHTHHAVDYPPPPTSPQKLSPAWKREDESEPEEATTFLRAIPTWDGRLRSRAGTGFHLLSQPLGYDPFVGADNSDNSSCHLRAAEPDKERTDEFTKLKGVLWPGMDIFDAATEQMRRKRNQKKDENVLKMMEKTSRCVEPTELVFSPTGMLRRQRVISGEVEDSSPLRGEWPIPKRIPRPKRVLSQVDPNIHLHQNKKRMKKSSDDDSSKNVMHGSRNLRSPRITRKAASRLVPLRCDDRCSSHGDDDDNDDDFDLTLRGLDPKPRAGFSVFRDEPNLCDAEFKDEGGPRLGSPVFCRRDEFPYSTFQSVSSNHATNLARKPTPILGKESLEPFLDEHEKVGPSFAWQSPALKRRYANDAAYPPQVFLRNTPRLGFDLFDDHDETPDELPTLPKLDMENHHIYSADASSSIHEVPSVARDASPNATISEVDEEDEFERFCLTGSFY